jgi:hypothetical protein
VIPLDVAADPQALEGSEAALRGKLHDAQAALRRAEALERAAAELPSGATTLGTMRLLAQQRRLAERRVQLYQSALQTVEREEGLRAR